MTGCLLLVAYRSMTVVRGGVVGVEPLGCVTGGQSTLTHEQARYAAVHRPNGLGDSRVVAGSVAALFGRLAVCR